MAKQIALKIKTALDRVGQARESKPAYEADTKLGCDVYVTVVLAWTVVA
jgi:hypothetical protein